MKYCTDNEGTVYRGRDHDAPDKDEAAHIQICPVCGQEMDMRDLGIALHHATPDHEPLPAVN
ncbi:MAG: hypothetical protein EOR73_28520 [Mesorhizobium sp.]|nr:MAG: hypothetical protein EOR73_28520 [Mesorhizobium sp.]